MLLYMRARKYLAESDLKATEVLCLIEDGTEAAHWHDLDLTCVDLKAK